MVLRKKGGYFRLGIGPRDGQKIPCRALTCRSKHFYVMLRHFPGMSFIVFTNLNEFKPSRSGQSGLTDV